MGVGRERGEERQQRRRAALQAEQSMGAEEI